MNEHNHIAAFVAANSAVITEHLSGLIEDGQQVIAIPDGYSVKDLEALQAQRRQARGEYRTGHFGDFLAYAQGKPQTDGILFIDPEQLRAQAIFDYAAGQGHARDRAVYNARLTDAVQALVNLCEEGGIRQEALIRYLEDWKDDVRPYATSGNEISVAEAIHAVRDLTLERAKTIKQLRGDFAFEQSAAEKAALRQEGVMPGGIVLRDVIYQGTQDAQDLHAKLSVVLYDSGFELSLRLVGFEAIRRDKAQEMAESAEEALSMPVFFGGYDAK